MTYMIRRLIACAALSVVVALAVIGAAMMYQTVAAGAATPPPPRLETRNCHRYTTACSTWTPTDRTHGPAAAAYRTLTAGYGFVQVTDAWPRYTTQYRLAPVSPDGRRYTANAHGRRY